ncbi:MAG TPA: TetR family transcriptional regulator C-terminal domain-containing protein [Pseudonocardiaceae bacterium]|nr:TetR family transcriptional regulator C-terminal domain-containing protein [Pseudonocardiaceae bacterium]
MPKKVDRRAEIADALWRVTRRDGWEAVTMRQVAAEAGVSVGMVQHHFASKDQMLRFALDKIGTDYGGRIAARIGALPEPRDPREVVRIVLTELLPGEGEGHVEVQAAAAFLGRAVLHPEIAAPMVAAGARLRDYVAAQIRTARPDADADLDAAGLLALADGLIAHLLTGRLTAEMAHAILAAQLDRVFGGSDAAQH